MLTNFSALFWLSNVLSFSLIKISLFAISLKRLSTLDAFISKPSVTHLNTATYSKAYTTVKRLTKRVDKFFQ